jgi:hypothetical protein
MSMDLNELSKKLRDAAKEAGVDPSQYRLGKSSYTGGEMKITFDHANKTFHVNNA